MPGRMIELEQGCLKVLMSALRNGLVGDAGVQVMDETFVDDGIPTMTLRLDGQPIIQIVVIATDLTATNPPIKHV